ncbi:DNA-directed RNA polymerase III subunit rpc25 [Tulasnella sp. UAMH 9824]|nr:DNA-directed RNA polymerase III subunit rpc25 [Tulasnella sp. UAMH 9824]
MYQLSVIKDTIPIHPTSFHLPTEKALLNQLNKKYADRVIPDVGLGISVFDILEAGEGKVRYGDGCFWHKVTFRLIVFRPFVSEVIVGTVTSCTEKFIHVSIGFFHDISVPFSLIPAPHAYDPNENAHFTLSGADPEMSEEEMLETDVTQRLYIDKGEVVRIRVEEDKFHDDEPGPPKAVDGTYIKPKMQRPHYEIIASMSGAGLGCVAWWAAPPDVDAAPS